MIDREFALAGLMVTPAYEATYVSTVLAFVRAGLGVAILPASMLDGAAMIGLEARRLSSKFLTREIGIIKLAKRSLGPAAEKFSRSLRAGRAA